MLLSSPTLKQRVSVSRRIFIVLQYIYIYIYSNSYSNKYINYFTCFNRGRRLKLSKIVVCCFILLYLNILVSLRGNIELLYAPSVYKCILSC